jgi:hypothetical protein
MLHDALLMFVGASLVSGGVLTAAAADRIRGIRGARAERQRQPSEPEAAIATAITEPATPRAREARMPQSVAAMHAAATGRADVVLALRGAGYKSRGLAERMADACTDAERADTVTWTRAALQRAANRVEA